MTFEEWWGAMYAEWSAKTGFETYYTDEVQKLCAQAWDAASDAARTASFAHGAKMHSSKAFCPLWRVHACTCPEDECRGKIALCHTPTTGNVAAPAPTKTTREQVELLQGWLGRSVTTMDNQQPTHLPCRLCGTAAYVPPVVDGGDHEHHQVACNECGIEVCRLSSAEALDLWNRLMGPNAKHERTPE